jgi:hypothetical protein
MMQYEKPAKALNITRLTWNYIDSHPVVKNCLRKGLVNHSALARTIKKELVLPKKTKLEAIIIAARRAKEGMRKSRDGEKRIIDLFKNSEVELKNKISVVRLDKPSIPDYLIDFEKYVKRKKDIFFAIEGRKTITIIVQDKNVEMLEQKFRRSIISVTSGAAMVIIESEGIEEVPGAVSFLTTKLFENGVNIIEMILLVQHQKELLILLVLM